jgi:CBS domain-containing protein
VLDGDRVSGIITDRDIAVRAVARNANPAQVHVRDIMTPGAEHVTEDQDVEDAARLMEEKQIRRILVTGPEGNVIGIVSLGDIAVHTHNVNLGGAVLERVSEPARPER